MPITRSCLSFVSLGACESYEAERCERSEAVRYGQDYPSAVIPPAIGWSSSRG